MSNSGGRISTRTDERLRMARASVPVGYPIAIDANQAVDRAGDRVGQRARSVFDLGVVEEPTSRRHPRSRRDRADIARPHRERGSTSEPRPCSSSSCRPAASTSCRSTRRASAGVNENIANLLSSRRSSALQSPTPAAGLCEAVRRPCSMFDFVAVSGSVEGRMIEYVDHLHERFVTHQCIREVISPRFSKARGPEMHRTSSRHTWRPVKSGGWCMSVPLLVACKPHQ